MKEALFQGFSLGLLLSLSIGPVFFALIQTSIDKGFKSGALMATGIMISDSLYIVVTYLGVSSLSAIHNFKVWLGIIGGAIMVTFGITTFLRKTVSSPTQIDDDTSKSKAKYIVKGFALNGINPFVFIFWLGIASVVNFQEGFTTSEVVVFFSSIIGVVFGLDLTKAFLANKLRHHITTKIQLLLNKLVGCGLLIFGFYLIVMTYLGKI